MKDAYFEKQWVYSTGSSLNIHKIVNKLFTWSELKDVLFTNNWRYLSDEYWFHNIDKNWNSIKNLNWTWFLNVEYKNWNDYLSNW
jgi:hypothetical protein